MSARTWPAWTRDALCAEVGTDLFYPEGEDGRGGKGSQYATTARQVCARCSVVVECLEWALEYEAGVVAAADRGAHGVYGGKTPQERRAILKRRRVAPCAPDPRHGSLASRKPDQHLEAS